MHRFVFARLCGTLVLLATASGASAETHAFINARIIPISGAPIENGTLVVTDGKIVAVGASGAVKIPGGATSVDLAGKMIMPGLVDTHSHIGGPAGADGSAPIQPDVRVLDAINVRDHGIQRAQAGGITTRQRHARLRAPAQRADGLPEAATTATRSTTW